MISVANKMVLDKLGSNLYDALRKVIRAPLIDEATIKELIRDFQRALLQADVNVSLVMELSQKIQKRALEEKIPPGISKREHVIKVVYEELTNLLGDDPKDVEINPGKKNILMLVGIQGSGKTTQAAKLARLFKIKGLKTGLMTVDTFRPGAYNQLMQLSELINVDFYGEEEEKDPIIISKRGINYFQGYDVVIVDTSGRHKEELGLISEMKQIANAINPNEIILVLDGTIGQQAAVQAEAFMEATPIGSIIISKLDGTARGGGALSGVAAIGAPIKFIGTGEKIEDIEKFNPKRFIGRLLGMGDIEGLIAKVNEAEAPINEKDVKAIISGRFTLEDMYKQFEAMQSIGPLQKILGMIPGFSYKLPQSELVLAEERLSKWKVIIQSMTPDERSNPRIINSSRIRRVSRGSGTEEVEVRELIKQYSTMKKMLKRMKGSRRMRRQLPISFG
jgi:signal recognition particle subunit SRP54